MTTPEPLDLLLFCHAKPDVGPGAGPDSLTAAARSAVTGLPGVEVALATLLPAEALPGLAHVAGLDPALPDAIVTLRGPGDELLRAAQRVTQALSAQVDRQRASLLATRRHAILPGRDAIRLFFGLRRLERLSRAQFQDYWLNVHAHLGRRLIPPYTYHQLHALDDPDQALSAALATATGWPVATFDGVVEVHFPDLPAFVAQLSRREVAEEALADERNFIDHARSLFWAYAEQ